MERQIAGQEFVAYRTGAGLAMGYLYTEMIRPILQEHPELEPEEMKASL